MLLKCLETCSHTVSRVTAAMSVKISLSRAEFSALPKRFNCSGVSLESQIPPRGPGPHSTLSWDFYSTCGRRCVSAGQHL